MALDISSKLRSWTSSLQFRLILGFALVLALTLGAVSLYVGWAASQEVKHFEQRSRDVRIARLQRFAARHYQSNQGWGNVQGALEQAGPLSDRRVVITDQTGAVMGDSDRDNPSPWDPDASGSALVPVVAEGRPVGSLLLGPPGNSRPFPEPLPSRMATSVNRSLLYTGLAAGVLLIIFLSRRVLAPVHALSAAASRLGRGDLSQRVATSGRGEIGQLASTFNTMAANLEDAERQRRNLVADVAHELRTPLSNIQGYMEAIEDGVLVPDSATITTVHQQVQHLVRLVEDLRLLAQAEAGALRLDRQPEDLAGLLSQVVEAFRPRAESKGVGLELQMPPNLAVLDIDRTRIAQVVSNLLDNAIFHTPTGKGVSVIAEMAEPGWISVSVVDQGTGIPAEDLPRVFERFYRVDPSRTRNSGGAGLGLTIARQLVEAHGGSISAESTMGQGSRFTARLPVADKGAG